MLRVADGQLACEWQAAGGWQLFGELIRSWSVGRVEGSAIGWCALLGACVAVTVAVHLV